MNGLNGAASIPTTQLNHGHTYTRAKHHARGGQRLPPPFTMPRIPSERVMGESEVPSSSAQSLKPPNGSLGFSGHRRHHPHSLVEPSASPGLDPMTNRPKSMDAANLLPLSSATLSDSNEFFTPRQEGLNHETEESPVLSSSSPASEALNACLLTLPFVTIDMLFSRHSHSAGEPGGTDDAGQFITPPALPSTLLATTLILTFAGVYTKYRSGATLQNGKTENAPTTFRLDMRAVQEASQKAVSVALPIYSSLNLGGSYIAILFLVLSAAGLMPLDHEKHKLDRIGGWKRLFLSTPFTLTVISISFIFFLLDPTSDGTSVLGILTAILSLFILNPPFQRPRSSFAFTILQPPSAKSTSAVPSSPSEKRTTPSIPLKSTMSPLLVTGDADLTIVSAVLTAALTLLTAALSRVSIVNPALLLKASLVSGTAFAVFLYYPPHSQQSLQKLGVASGVAFVTLLALVSAEAYGWAVFLACIGGASIICLRYDVNRSKSTSLSSGSHPHHSHHNHSHGDDHKSALTKFLLRHAEDYPSFHIMLSDKNSRGLFYYMLLNMAFMVVQAIYAYITDSLGLISDSVHMFFDCAALAFGLWARIMSKRPRNSRFPYGFGKIESLSGFGNGVLLLVISVEIVYEAVERLFDDHEVHGLLELFIVSSLGLAVNVVGVLSFDHGHAHGHSHEGHSHDHSDENLYGIYLHILADLLGSVTVVISTAMIHFFGWSGFDPIASMAIAILIFISAIPMVQSSAKKLLLALPDKTEYELRDQLSDLTSLRGVVGYTVPRFWLEDEMREDDHDHHHHHHHQHDHDHYHKHDHEHTHDHHHNDEQSHGHDHSHDHGHDDHFHTHHDDHSDAHTHDLRSHDHHDHKHDHSPSPACSHTNYDHSHTSPSEKEKLLGVVHVIATRSVDLNDLRRRIQDFMTKNNMELFIQIEREGEGRCWCGGGLKV